MKILSRRDAAAKLGLSERTLDRLCEIGAIRKVQISTRRVGITEAEIDTYLERVVAQAAA